MKSHLQVYQGQFGTTIILDNYLVSGPSLLGGETLIVEKKIEIKDIKRALGIEDNE